MNLGLALLLTDPRKRKRGYRIRGMDEAHRIYRQGSKFVVDFYTPEAPHTCPKCRKVQTEGDVGHRTVPSGMFGAGFVTDEGEEIPAGTTRYNKITQSWCVTCRHAHRR